MAQKLVLQVDLSNIGRTVGELRKVRQSVDSVGDASEEASKSANQLDENFGRAATSAEALGQALFSSSDDANKLANSLGLTAEQALAALRQLGQLREQGASTEDQFKALSDAFNLNQDQFNLLTNAIDEGNARTSQYIKNIQALTKVSRDLGLSFNESRDLSLQLGLSPQEISESVRQIRELRNLNADLSAQFDAVSKSTGLNVQQFNRLSQEIDNAGERTANFARQSRSASNETGRIASGTDQVAGSADRLASGLSGAAIQLNALVQAGQTLVSVLRPAFDLLISQNEILNNQLLSTQASLSATSRIFQDGIEIEGPGDAIDALAKPVEDAIARIREESFKLTGVTASDLIPLFQQLASSAQAITNQSKELPDPLDAAQALTVDFSAALRGVGLDLSFAREEVNSILNGTISVDSQLAKTLGLTNAQVQNWKEQGVLVDQLRDRLEAFRVANERQAETLGGTTTNIQSIIEEISRVAGEPLFEEVVGLLQRVQFFLEENRDAIQDFTSDAAEEFLRLATAALDAATQVANAIAPVVQALGPTLGENAALAADGLILTAEAAGRLANALAPVVAQLAKIGIEASKVADVARETVGIIVGGFRGDAETVSTFGDVTRQLSRETFRTVQQMRVAIEQRNAAQEEGIELSDEELRRQQAQLTISEDLAASLQDQREALIAARRGTADRRARGELQEQIDAVDELILSLEEEQEAFNELGGELDIVSRQSQAFAQAQRLIKTESEEAKEAVEEAQLAELEAASQTQALLDQGAISSEEANQRRLSATVNRIQAELAAEREKLRELLSIDVGEIEDESQRREVESSLRQTRIRIAQLGNEASEQQAQLERNILQARVQAIEDTANDALEATRAAETERLIAVQELINQGVLSEEDAQSDRLSIVRDRITQELEAERQKLEELRALPSPVNADERDALEDQIRQVTQRTADLTLNLLEAEQRERQNLADQAIRSIRDRTVAVEQSAQRELSGLQSVTDSLQRQNELLSAQSNLRQAQAALVQSEGDIQVQRLQRALQLTEQLANEDDSRVRNILQQQLRELGVGRDRESLIRQIAQVEQSQIQQRQEAFERESELRRRQLEIELRLQRAAAQRLQIETQLAALQARSALQEAQEIVDPAERQRAVEAAQLQTQLADQAASSAAQNLEAQSESASLAREALDAELEREEAQIEFNSLLEQQNNQLRQAEQLTRSISESLSGSGIGGGSITQLPGLRTGGPLQPGGIYRVHAGETITTAPTGGYVLNRKDSMAAASQALSIGDIRSTNLAAQNGLQNPVIPGLSSISATGTQDIMPTLRSIDRKLDNLQSGMNIGSVSMPQVFQLERDDRRVAEIASNVLRDSLRGIRGYRGPRF